MVRADYAIYEPNVYSQRTPEQGYMLHNDKICESKAECCKTTRTHANNSWLPSICKTNGQTRNQGRHGLNDSVLTTVSNDVTWKRL